MGLSGLGPQQGHLLGCYLVSWWPLLTQALIPGADVCSQDGGVTGYKAW